MDTGLACYLLGIRDAATLERHPLRGNVSESFVVAELVKHLTAVRRDAPLYHWRDATGHEIDVLIDTGDRLIPVEAKFGAYKHHIDRTLLRQNLRRTVTEWIENLITLRRLAAQARRAGQSRRGAS